MMMDRLARLAPGDLLDLSCPNCRCIVVSIEAGPGGLSMFCVHCKDDLSPWLRAIVALLPAKEPHADPGRPMARPPHRSS